MDRLRETIELLSKLLYENASLKVRAEVFRAAKFNNVEAVSVDRLLQIYKRTTRADEWVPDNLSIARWPWLAKT